MSAPIALPLPRYMAESMSAATVVSKVNPKVKYLLTLIKGQNRPSEHELVYVSQRHERDEPIPVQWECMGIFESRGAAQAAQAWYMRQVGAHKRDKWQISPFVENDMLSKKRFHLADDADNPPETEYEVINKAELRRIVQRLEALLHEGG